MTTELKEQFFKVFGVEPKDYYGCNWDGYCPYDNEADKCGGHCPYWSKYKNDYPKITDRILLELICIAYSTHDIDLTIEEIKENILQNLIKSKDDVKQQIQQLFQEKE